jgi:hypothetical protein
MSKNISRYIIEFVVIVLSISISFFLENKRIENETKNRARLIKINLKNELNNANAYLQSRDKAYSMDLDFLNAYNVLAIPWPSHIPTLPNASCSKDGCTK